VPDRNVDAGEGSGGGRGMPSSRPLWSSSGSPVETSGSVVCWEAAHGRIDFHCFANLIN
jgi:hypothetical protein